MKNVLGISLQRFKDFFKPKDKIIEVSKSVDDIISGYLEEKIVIKSLFDNDVIDLDEYIEKIRIIDDMIGDVFKKETSKSSYADAIIRNGAGDILFLRRNSSSDFWPDCWGLPGGKIESGETAEQAVKREVQEETGRDILECYMIAKKYLSDGNTISIFECVKATGVDDQIILDNNEHYSYQYINKYDYDKYNFIADLKDVLLQIDNRFKPTEKDAQVIKSIDDVQEVYMTDLEFVTENKGVKLESIKKLFDEGSINEEYFLRYIQAVNGLPDSYFSEKLDANNQTKPSEFSIDDVVIKGGGEDKESVSEDVELNRAEKVDLITLPEKIGGANCGNCKYINYQNWRCENKKVDQEVNNRMCCILWDAEGVIRKWEHYKPT